MTFKQFQNRMMSYASAPCANAASACTRSTSAHSAIIILDAMIMASIIICALLNVVLLGLVNQLVLISLLAVILLAAAVVKSNFISPMV